MSIEEGCKMNQKGCSKKSDQKLDTFDWLCDIPESSSVTDLVEVTFKNTRKGYFRNSNELTLEKGDIVYPSRLSRQLRPCRHTSCHLAFR